MISTPAYLVALAGLVLSAPALTANDSATTEAGAQAKPKAKVICKRETNVGSNLAAKVCKTEAEWKDELASTRRGFEERDKD